MEEIKYYCDRCEEEIKEFKPKNIFYWLFTRKDYMIDFTFYPAEKIKQKVHMCQDCNISFMKWFSNKTSYNKDYTNKEDKE